LRRRNGFASRSGPPKKEEDKPAKGRALSPPKAPPAFASEGGGPVGEKAASRRGAEGEKGMTSLPRRGKKGKSIQKKREVVFHKGGKSMRRKGGEVYSHLREEMLVGGGRKGPKQSAKKKEDQRLTQELHEGRR